MRLRMILTIGASFLSVGALAQSPGQLDFLAGNWTLHDNGGAQVGRSQIVVQAPGAMIYEERRVGDQPAQPLWFENSERNRGWTQLFLGPAGQTREFPTLSEPGVWPIIMGADVVLRDGTPARFRLTMTRMSDNETRRVLEISRDQGATWNPVFDYTYRRTSSLLGLRSGLPSVMRFPSGHG